MLKVSSFIINFMILIIYCSSIATVSVPSTVSWIKFNKNQVGYYRVNYPEDMWQEIISALVNNRGVFSTADRAHLISDVFALADASQLNYSIALDLSAYLSKELDYVPWKVGISCLNSVKNLLYYTDSYRDFAVYARSLLAGAYNEIGWEVESDHLRKYVQKKYLNLFLS